MKSSKYLFLLLILYSCAQIVTPDGGAKDTKPPVILKCKPKLGSLNFSNEKIILTFDERIELKNVAENISITPDLNYKPKISAHKNTIEIIIHKDSLEKNTTYSINFGSSITDINESNILENFNYTFSSGSFLDTSFISGIALSIKENKPISNAVISLQNTLNSIKYSGLTDKNGIWKINNISKGNYTLLIYKDNNSNKKLSNTEPYYKKNLTIADTSLFFKSKLIIYTSWDSKPLKTLNAKYLDNYSLSLTFSKPPTNIENLKYSLNIASNKKENSLAVTERKDSFILYHPFFEKDTLLLSIQTDTLQSFIICQPKKRIKDTQTFTVITPTISKRDPILIKTIIPIKHTNSEKIKINGSTLGFEIKLLSPYKLSIIHHQIVNKQIVFENGAFNDINGDNNNQDTLNIKIAQDEQTGSYDFIIKDSVNNFTGNVICKISNENNNYIINTLVNKSNSLKGLLPGNYTLEVWFDENKNNEWDEGNYELNIFPEKIILLKNFITIKPNWDSNGVEIYMD